RQFWGTTKRNDLLRSLEDKNFNAQYELVNSTRSDRFSFKMSNVAPHYLNWPKLVELCIETPISGLQEMRKGALMDIELKALETRMRLYYDSSVDWSTIKELGTGLTIDGGGFDAKAARTKLQGLGKFNPEQLIRYALYPFDVRWCYY